VIRHEPAVHICSLDKDHLGLAATSTTLLRFYREILVPNFRPDEMFAEDMFMTAQFSEAVRTILAWDDKIGLVGGLTGHWYPTCRVFLVDYLVVRPEFRGRGIGSALLRHGSKQWSCELSPVLILGEVEDPRQYSDTGFGNPSLRFRFYGRLGARVLQLPYFQPALGPSGSRVRGLLLMVFSAQPDAYTGSTTIAGEPLDCFIRQYVTECEGCLEKEDAELQRLLTPCRITDGVPLLPVGALSNAHLE
jgi:GNAT superfamily N-acetyltransferase